MDKVRTKSAAKQVSVKKSASTGDAKRNAEKALGKGKGALDSKKDKLSNDFST